MRYEYSKEPIKITKWFVSSADIERLYEFFQKRFPEQNIEIELITASGHAHIYETLDEYLENVPKLAADSETVSQISISGREQTGLSLKNYRHAWVDIHFSRYHNDATIHIIGGDTDESNKDWVEGTYSEALKLKNIFENKHSNGFLSGKLQHSLKGVVYDPDESKYRASINKNSEGKSETTQKVELITGKHLWYQRWWGQIIIGVFIAVSAAGITFWMGWLK